MHGIGRIQGQSRRRYLREWGSAAALFKPSVRERCRTKIIISISALAATASGLSESTCWYVRSGLLHALPAVRVKLATTHSLSIERVATSGSSTARNLL